MNETNPMPSNSTLEPPFTDNPLAAYRVILSSIISFGLVGNVISLVTIYHSRLRQVPANLYLIVLTYADSVFLLGILMVMFKLDFVYELCLVIEYILGTASYVSSWSIAGLTVERYIAIAHPLLHIKYGGAGRWKRLSWLPIPFVMNTVLFFSLKYYNDPEQRRCMPGPDQFQMAIEIADVVLVYLVPCIAVVSLNLLVADKMRSTKRGFREVANRGGSTRHGGSTNNAGTTRILLIVPVVYILLNTPFYLIRIADTVASTVFGSDMFSVKGGLKNITIFVLYQTAHYLYYFNFACDVIVYAFSSCWGQNRLIRNGRTAASCRLSSSTDNLALRSADDRQSSLIPLKK